MSHRAQQSDSATSAYDLSVVIVSYNVRDLLAQALRSVEEAQGDLDLEVFVVDNNSADGSAEMVRRRFPDVHLIANADNVGFSRANNQALRQARGRYVLLLNPDTILREDTLSTLVRFLDEHPQAGAVGCQILHPDGTFELASRRAFPTPEVAFYRMTGLSRLFPSHRRFGRYNMTYLPRDEVAEVDALSGSCMMVRRAALYADRSEWINGQEGKGQRRKGKREDSKIACGGAGLLDEDFFMYGEDLDWCRRIQQAGWRIYYTPETEIIHYKGESTTGNNLKYLWWFYRAMLQFADKHFRGRYPAPFVALLKAGILLRAGVAGGAHLLRQLRSYLTS